MLYVVEINYLSIYLAVCMAFGKVGTVCLGGRGRGGWNEVPPVLWIQLPLPVPLLTVARNNDIYLSKQASKQVSVWMDGWMDVCKRHNCRIPS